MSTPSYRDVYGGLGHALACSAADSPTWRARSAVLAATAFAFTATDAIAWALAQESCIAMNAPCQVWYQTAPVTELTDIIPLTVPLRWTSRVK